jgi:hypothetical protein
MMSTIGPRASREPVGSSSDLGQAAADRKVDAGDVTGLARQSPEALAEIKRLVRTVVSHGATDGYHAEIEAYDRHVRGKDIRKGDLLHIMIGAANRDPAQFDDPDRLDIARSPNRHVTLGHGVHYCLGAALARLELRIAVGSFLSRFPDYRLASEKIVFMDRTASRRPTSVPVLAH